MNIEKPESQMRNEQERSKPISVNQPTGRLRSCRKEADGTELNQLERTGSGTSRPSYQPGTESRPSRARMQPEEKGLWRWQTTASPAAAPVSINKEESDYHDRGGDQQCYGGIRPEKGSKADGERNYRQNFSVSLSATSATFNRQ